LLDQEVTGVLERMRILR